MRYANDELVTALRWCSSHKDFSRSRDAKQMIETHSAALQLIDRLHQQTMQDAAQLKEHLRQMQLQLAADPSMKQIDETVDADLAIATNRERNAIALRHAERALGVISTRASQLIAGIEAAAELLPIIAAERCIDVAACNDDAMSRETLTVWRKMSFDWHPRWQIGEDELLLPHRLVGHGNCASHDRLPITWSQWDNERMRASIAWVWQQLAAGHFKIADVPALKGSPMPDRPRKCIKLTADFDGQLPKVPKVPDQRRGSSFSVIGISR